MKKILFFMLLFLSVVSCMTKTDIETVAMLKADADVLELSPETLSDTLRIQSNQSWSATVSDGFDNPAEWLTLSRDEFINPSGKTLSCDLIVSSSSVSEEGDRVAVICLRSKDCSMEIFVKQSKTEK